MKILNWRMYFLKKNSLGENLPPKKSLLSKPLSDEKTSDLFKGIKIGNNISPSYVLFEGDILLFFMDQNKMQWSLGIF